MDSFASGGAPKQACIAELKQLEELGWVEGYVERRIEGEDRVYVDDLEADVLTVRA